MMGFGASALIVGNAADAMFKSEFGWRVTYSVLGVAILVVMLLAAVLLKLPSKSVVFPMAENKKMWRRMML